MSNRNATKPPRDQAALRHRRHDRPREWLLVALLPVVMWLTHYAAVLPHEFAHSVTAWLVGIKPEPGNIDWGGTSLWNITMLSHVDENVNYSGALAAGRNWQVALVAFAGPGLGNLVPYLVSRRLIGRPFFARRRIAAFVLFWYLFFGLANLYDYVPLRTFAHDGDVTHFVLAANLSRWAIYAIGGYLILWAVVDFYRRVLPIGLAAFGFGPVKPARAIVLLAATAMLFGYFAIPALEESDQVSVFMGRTSLLVIPAIVVATWRRNVSADLPGPGLGPTTRELVSAGQVTVE